METAAIIKHIEWIESAGEKGEQISLDDVDMRSFPIDPRILEQGFFSDCNFSEISFTGTDFYLSEFYSCDFSNARFTDCDFTKTTLDYCIFSGAVFENCKFPRADAFQSVFQKCSFRNCSFVGFNLMDCDLQSSAFTSVDFDAAYLDKVKIEGAVFTDPENLPLLNHLSIISAENQIIEGKQAVKWINSNE